MSQAAKQLQQLPPATAKTVKELVAKRLVLDEMQRRAAPPLISQKPVA